MKATAGRTITYTVAATGQTFQFSAWPGKTLFAGETESRARVTWGEADYLFQLADALAVGCAFPPAEGDRITDSLVTDPTTGKSVTFELQTPTQEPVWRYSDETRLTIRVHCKRVLTS
jgi:hypothetical protein